MMKRLTILGLVIGVLAMAPSAQAVPITGSISFTAAAQPMGGISWVSATGVDFLTGTGSVDSSPIPTGSYLGTQGLATLFNDFTFNPFAPVTPLWSFTSGAISYSFDYLTLGSLTQVGNNVNSAIYVLNGKGMLYVTGYDPTPGLFSLTAQGFGTVGSPGSTFSFSSSNVPTVPDGGSMVMLLGMALVGLAGVRRMMN